MLKLLATVADVHSTITDIRLRTPLLALAQRGGCELRLVAMHDCTSTDLAWADVLVLQRPTTRRAWRLLQQMQASGGQVVVEMDDLLTRIDPQLDTASAVRAGLPWLRRCLAAADGVSVSTAVLGQALADDVKRWQVVPNSAALLFNTLPAAPVGAPVTLLFAASDHLHGGSALTALRAVQAQHGAAVQVLAIGRAADALAAAGIQARRLPAMPRAEFVAVVRALPHAVAVVPLADTEFNDGKSAIKFFDYAAVGIPVLCSDVTPYREVVQNGVTGALVADNEAAWTAALQLAIASPAWRQRVATTAQLQVAQQHTLDHTVNAWRTLLQSLPQRSSPARSIGPWWGLLSERLQVALRNANRARLVRRTARRAARHQAPDKPS